MNEQPKCLLKGVNVQFFNILNIGPLVEVWRFYAELLNVIEICNHFVHILESVYIIFL